MPKITIAIPTYNRKDYLKECIQSILNQTFQDFVIYVFDNCSDYDIKTFLRDFNDERIRLIRSETTNLGNSGNFERIFHYKFETDYLVVFHDDDVMHRDMLKMQVDVMNEYSDLIYVATSMNFISDSSKMNVFKKIKNKKVFFYNDETELVNLLLSGFHLCYNSVMYRQKKLEGMSPASAKFLKWSDRPFLVNLSKKRRVAVFKQKLVNYRIHAEQDSQTNDVEQKKMIECMINLLFFYKENLKNNLSKSNFYSYSTNNSINLILEYPGNFDDKIIFLKDLRKKGLFRFRSVGFVGVYYLFKFLARKIK
jgi:glycosyltransferase involved in cell wall biosynthesis